MKLPEPKHLCRNCQTRPALYKRKWHPKAKVSARKDHDLCMQCFRSQADRNKAMEAANEATR